MSLAMIVLVLALATLASALFSGLETGIYMWSKTEPGRRGRLPWLISHTESLVITCLVGNNIVNSLVTWSFGALLAALSVEVSLRHLSEILILIPFLFIVGEVVPKGLFHAHAGILMPAVSWILGLCRVVFAPLVTLFRVVTGLLLWLLRSKSKRDAGRFTRKRLAWLLQDSEGGLTREQTKMAQNVLELKETPVAGLMVPCRKTAWVDASTPLAAVKKKFLGTEFNFLIVSEKKSEAVQGIVYMNRILLADNSGKLTDYLQPIPAVSYGSSLTSALEVLRENSVPVAKVTGSSGGVIGLLFTRRVVQQIVGELQIW